MTMTTTMKSKAWTTISFLSLLSAGHATDPVTEVLGDAYGEVVFLRQESNGSLNILPCSITCNMWERLTIYGGEAASLYLREGEYEFQAYSPEPYQKESDPTSCRSAALKVKITKGRRSFVDVAPQPAEGKLRFHWLLKKRNANPQGGANGRQPIRSKTNSTSSAAASRRSP